MRKGCCAYTLYSVRPSSPLHGLLLSRALDRFHSELDDKDDTIIDVGSVSELISQTKALQPERTRPLPRLEPILTHINDFAAVIAFCSGADPKTTGLVWGSLKVLLMLATPTGPAYNDVLDMLNELGLSLPRFRSYEDSLPMDKGLEGALVDVYAEVICFCARTINFFRQNPHRPLLRSGWPKLDSDFKRTISRLKNLSRAVDTEAEAVRLRTDISRNTELLEAMSRIHVKPQDDQAIEISSCYVLPHRMNDQIFERETEIAEIGGILDPESDPDTRKCLVLHGLGGVGKTKIALAYANRSRAKFHAIFWISADNSIKLSQSYVEVAKKLKLAPVGDEVDAVTSMDRVKNWLAEARK